MLAGHRYGPLHAAAYNNQCKVVAALLRLVKEVLKTNGVIVEEPVHTMQSYWKDVRKICEEIIGCAAVANIIAACKSKR